MRSLARLALASLASFAFTAWAQDGSSSAAAQPQEVEEELRAAIAEFEAADAALNAVYELARETLPPTEFARLRLEQREWLAARDPEAEAYAQVFAGLDVEDVRETSFFHEYRTGLTESRTDLLRGLVAYYLDPGSQSWEGLWVDGFGGHLALRELDDGRLRFQLTVVRSPALHTGWIEGVAERNGGLAIFETAFETADGEDRLWVFFVRDGAYLRVSTSNAHHFAGARAYFDGGYVRLRDLEPFDID